VPLFLTLLACAPFSATAAPTPRPTRTPLPTLAPIPLGTLDPSGAATPSPPPVMPQPGWEQLAPGLELRVAWMWVSGVSGPVEITLVRINPAYYDLRVHYALDEPATVAHWSERTGAAVLINGAFFEPGETVIGLVVEGGEPHGESLPSFGGMLSVSGGEVRVRSLRHNPVQPGETFDYAVQGRPTLLEEGGIPASFNFQPEASRRTAVAQDREGNILFIVNDFGAVSLYALRDWLATTPDLNLNVAFNLDGGGSTGLAIRVGDRVQVIDSWWPVATAVAAYPK